MHWLSLLRAAAFSIVCFTVALSGIAQELKIGTFDIDVSPSVGSPLAYDPALEITNPLSLKGIVLVPAGEAPIVMCAADWLGIANAAQDRFRGSIASAVNTTADRVVVHALHQHDAPRCDLTAASVLAEFGGVEQHFDVEFIEECVERAASAAGEARQQLQTVKSIQFSATEVEQVASNRRMLGPDGKVHTTRYTACRDPKIRALPEGVIDPLLKTLTFEGQSGPIAVLTFYATHPQSYYRTGGANPDFPGLARDARQADSGVFHLHFNGAGGNIGAGKYNDGAHENRIILANRMQSAMRRGFESRSPQTLEEIDWNSIQVQLPAAQHLRAESLIDILQDETSKPAVRLNAAKKLAYLRRQQGGKTIPISCLRISDNYILFLPGELFVEYQLAAQALRPDANVLMAAYGEYGTGYIGTRIAYSQGGYEVSERASNVSPESEVILMNAIRELLGAKDQRVLASDFTDTFGELP